MIIKLHIGYKTRYGQEMYVLLQAKSGKKNPESRQIKMEYDNETWKTEIDTEELGLKGTTVYRYVIRDSSAAELFDNCTKRTLHLKKIKKEVISVFDEWQSINFHSAVFESEPFTKVFHQLRASKTRKKGKKVTHSFQVEAPYLQEGRKICMIGACPALGEWKEDHAVELNFEEGIWQVQLNLQKEKFPLEYKYVVKNEITGHIVQYEQGSNRFLKKAPSKDEQYHFSAFPFFDQSVWRGAGINLPVSALRTAKSWGVGDFSDLIPLINWAHKNGIRMIQLLPVNDTIATHTIRDSYPYASISAYALHPQYLDVERVAREVEFTIDQEIYEEVKQLNESPTLQHIDVAKLKLRMLRLLYQKNKEEFNEDLDFFEFFNINREWLVPYAAFCYLRDLNNSANSADWEKFAEYNEEEIQELVSPGTLHYDDIALYYFIQYHLHLQLLDAVNYAKQKAVIFKGDLPIGVGRHSVETWVNPRLFHMDMQAGAPPDAFAIKGQNWEFPTYNWDEMAKDNYAWWRSRMENMGNYFDAIRIDHILGFFRIWSIPNKATEGILGVFVPALPFAAHELQMNGLSVSADYLSQPYINDNLINQIFGEDAGWAQKNVFSQGKLCEDFISQQSAVRYFEKNPQKSYLKQSVLDIISDVVLIRDSEVNDYFHFRINMPTTRLFQSLQADQQEILKRLYQQYFFGRQDELWKSSGSKKLNALQDNTQMLLCAEDLGMVPDFVETVLEKREILSLGVQRMPKKDTEQFSLPSHAPFLSVITPSTHDTSSIRQWWEEDKESIQYFFNHILGQYGMAPYYCEPWIATEIIKQHMHSPAMWAVFLMQDLLAMDGKLRIENPNEERINVPSNPNHNWNYRMHISIEELNNANEFNTLIQHLVKNSGR